MDDLKLLGRSEEDLENEIKHMKGISKYVNMNFGLKNGARICYKKSIARGRCMLEVHLRRTGPDKTI
jgi:hypothetical protein